MAVDSHLCGAAGAVLDRFEKEEERSGFILLCPIQEKALEKMA